jgi:signal transduction histidine kinase
MSEAKFSDPLQRVDVVVDCDDVSVSIATRDHGRGVAAEELAEIFEPFRRGSAAGGLPGSGLGLAIARAFAAANRGRLEVATPSDGGAIFTLVLPRIAAASLTAEPDPGPALELPVR